MQYRKRKKRIKEQGSERDYMLAEVRDKRPRSCGVCSRRLHSPEPYCFAHVLAKGSYPKYRYDKNNIILVCSFDHHAMVDKHAAGIKYLIEQELIAGNQLTFNMLIQMQNGD